MQAMKVNVKQLTVLMLVTLLALQGSAVGLSSGSSANRRLSSPNMRRKTTHRTTSDSSVGQSPRTKRIVSSKDTAAKSIGKVSRLSKSLNSKKDDVKQTKIVSRKVLSAEELAPKNENKVEFGEGHVAISEDALLGKEFKMSDFGAENVSLGDDQNCNDESSESGRILSKSCFTVKGEFVPKPFKSMDVRITPKTKLIYAIKARFEKPQGVYLDDKEFKCIWDQCGLMVNAQMGFRPTSANVDDATANCAWRSSDAVAILVTAREMNCILMTIVSTRLNEQAFDECPAGVADKKEMAARYAEAERKEQKRLKAAEQKIAAARTWYERQLESNTLIEQFFQVEDAVDGSGKVYCLCLTTDYTNPYNFLGKPTRTVTITETRGMIICEGIESSYAKRILGVRKMIYDAVGN